MNIISFNFDLNQKTPKIICVFVVIVELQPFFNHIFLKTPDPWEKYEPPFIYQLYLLLINKILNNPNKQNFRIFL